MFCDETQEETVEGQFLHSASTITTPVTASGTSANDHSPYIVAPPEEEASTLMAMKDAVKQKYSTTSTVFAEQSIAKPDFQKILFCIACVLQAIIFDSSVDPNSAALRNVNKELEMVTTLSEEYGGLCEKIPEYVLMRETPNDPELYQKIVSLEVPTVDSILRFIVYIQRSAKFSPECNIIAFIYIKRLLASNNTIHVHNWRGIWVGSVVLAQKVWDDTPLRTSSFLSILPNVTKEVLRELEIKIFELLNFCTGVRPSVYASYYFDLRDIYQCITGEVAGHEGPAGEISALSRKPLSIFKAKMMEAVDDAHVLASTTHHRRGSKKTSRKYNRSGVHATASSSADVQEVTAIKSAPTSPTQVEESLEQKVSGSVNVSGTTPITLCTSESSRRNAQISLVARMMTLEDITRTDSSRFVLS